MKILFMARNLVTEQSAPRYVLELSRELIKLGHEVVIATSKPREIIEGAEIVKLPRFFGRRSISPFLYSSCAQIIKLRGKVDIIHGNGYTLFNDVTTVHFLNRTNINRLKQYNMNTGSSMDLTDFALNSIFKSSKYLIAVSSLVEKDLIEIYNVPEERITVIHNGVNLNEFSPPNGYEREKIIKKYHLDPNVKLLLFVGGPAYERKGFKFLLESLHYMSKDIVLIATCKNLTKDYQKYTQDPELSSRLIIENFVPDISELYKAVDIYILPTIYDPFPLAVMEAMGSHLPTIISANCGCIDIINHGENGLIINDLNDSTAISEMINRLAEDKFSRQRLGMNARETALNMSWKSVAEKNLTIYRKLVQTNKKSLEG